MAHLYLFSAFRIRRLRVLFALLAFALFTMWSAPRAGAAGMMPGACGTICHLNGGGMFMPFNGTPFFPAMPNYYAYQTGQMSFYGPSSYYPNMGIDPMYVANALNWGGAQPIGLTMGAPIGGAALTNDYLYSRMSGAAR